MVPMNLLGRAEADTDENGTVGKAGGRKGWEELETGALKHIPTMCKTDSYRGVAYMKQSAASCSEDRGRLGEGRTRLSERGCMYTYD